MKAYTRNRGEYWSAICPQLTVAGEWPRERWDAPIASRGEDLAYVEQSMMRDGYFRVNNANWTLPVPHSALAECIVALRNHGWPGVFGYMYDEFWMLTRRLHSIVTHVLGAFVGDRVA